MPIDPPPRAISDDNHEGGDDVGGCVGDDGVGDDGVGDDDEIIKRVLGWCRKRFGVP